MAGAVEIKARGSNNRMEVNSDGSLSVKNAAATTLAVSDGGGSLTVDGTVTSVPSGTQTVSGTVTIVPSGTQTVTGTVTSVPGAIPGLVGAYIFNLPDQTGVVAANNFLSLFNPVASGKTIYLLGGSMAGYIGGGSSNVEVSLQALRTTAASAGTLQAASAICKFQTSQATPVAEVRTGNPTVTLGAAMSTLPPVIQPSTNNFVFSIAPPPGGGAFTLAPGEGVVIRTSSGDVDSQWNMTMVWGEA